MWLVVFNSFLLAISIAIVCVTSSIAIQVLLALSTLREPHNRGAIFENIVLFSCMPGVLLHPAIVIYYLVGSLDTGDGYLDSVIWMNNDTIGSFIVIGVFLHFAFAYIFVNGLKIRKLVTQWHISCVSYSIPKEESFLKIVLFPIIIRSIPFVLFLSLVTEGMVFLPGLHQSSASTIGRQLLESATGTGGTIKYATLIFLIFLSKVIIVFMLSHIFHKCEAKWQNAIITRNIYIPTTILKLVNSIAEAGLTLLYFTIPIILPVILIDFYLLYALMADLVNGLFISGGISNTVNALLSNTYHYPILFAAINTLYVAFVSAVLCIFVFLAIIVYAGKRDIWTFGRYTNWILAAGAAFSSVPIVIYAYLLSSRLATYPVFTIILLFLFVGLIYSLFIFGKGISTAFYGHEKLRSSLGINAIEYWTAFWALLASEVVVAFIFIWALLWNDTVIQMFAQGSFHGFPQALVSLTRDGLPVEESSGIALIQLIMIGLILPKSWIAIRQLTK